LKNQEGEEKNITIMCDRSSALHMQYSRPTLVSWQCPHCHGGAQRSEIVPSENA